MNKSSFKTFLFCRFLSICSLIIISLCFCFSCKAANTSTGSSDFFQMSGDPDYVSPNNVSISDATNQSTGLATDWWKDSAFYHVWVKSFKDSSFVQKLPVATCKV